MVVKQAPAFTIGQEKRISKRVYKEIATQFLGQESPGVGVYNPLKGSIEDKIMLH